MDLWSKPFGAGQATANQPQSGNAGRRPYSVLLPLPVVVGPPRPTQLSICPRCRPCDVAAAVCSYNERKFLFNSTVEYTYIESVARPDTHTQTFSCKCVCALYCCLCFAHIERTNQRNVPSERMNDIHIQIQIQASYMHVCMYRAYIEKIQIHRYIFTACVCVVLVLGALPGLLACWLAG